MAQMLLILSGLLALVFVGLPLLKPAAVLQEAESHRRRRGLQAEKARLFTSIRDLQLDFLTGKLAQEDHEALTQQAKLQAAGVIKQLDGLEPGRSASGAKKAVAKAASGAGVFCHKCGHRAETSDAFCSKCGTKLKVH